MAGGAGQQNQQDGSVDNKRGFWHTNPTAVSSAPHGPRPKHSHPLASATRSIYIANQFTRGEERADRARKNVDTFIADLLITLWQIYSV